MSDLRTIERRMRNLRMIREILSSMRSLSAVQLRHGTATLGALREHASTLRRALALVPAPALRAPRPTRVLLIVLGTDQGLCGPLVDRLVDETAHRAGRLAERVAGVVAVGRRTRDLLEAAGHEVTDTIAAPTSFRGLDALVGELAHTLEDAVAAGWCDGVEVVYARHEGGGDSHSAVHRVYPVSVATLLGSDVEPPAIPPQMYEPPEQIARALLEEHTYISVYRAAVESLTSEHGARLRTTDGATHTLDGKLEDLRLEHNHLRQEAITGEILEITSGADAVTGS